MSCKHRNDCIRIHPHDYPNPQQRRSHSSTGRLGGPIPSGMQSVNLMLLMSAKVHSWTTTS